MESANLHHQQQHHHHHHHHHQLQENNNNLVVGSSSSSAAPTPYGVVTKHAWTPSAAMATTLSNNSGNSSNSSLDLLSTNSMVPDLGFHWLNNLTSTDQQSAHDHLSRLKDELSSSSSSSDHHHHHNHHNSFPKLTDLLTNGATSSSIGDDQDQYYQLMKNDLSEKLLLKTLSSSGNFYNSNDHLQNNYSNMNIGGPMAPMGSSRSGGHFSQIYPSINVSNLNRSLSSSSMSSASLDMNLQAMDLLGASARFSPGGSTSSSTSSFSTQPNYSYDSFGTPHQSTDGHHHHRLSKISSYDNKVTEVKRPAGSLMEPKASQAGGPKKSRVESRSSTCPPFKVRKEKLGDRIAALQQLVAPFGKTDTASVLMEAIGYIKFLQNQVETLSVPYMKSSRNKFSKAIHGGMNVTQINGIEETKRDLRSRGLCLVPLSCMSYVTGDLGGVSGSVWPAPDFGGGT